MGLVQADDLVTRSPAEYMVCRSPGREFLAATSPRAHSSSRPISSVDKKCGNERGLAGVRAAVLAGLSYQASRKQKRKKLACAGNRRAIVVAASPVARAAATIREDPAR